MKEISVLPRTKNDYKNIELYLKNRDLLDESGLWFAGYDDTHRSARNAVAANLLYGKKRLQIISVKEDTIYYLKNSKSGFKLYEFGKISDSYAIRTWRNILWPSIKIESNDGMIHIQATKNKKNVFKLKKLIK